MKGKKGREMTKEEAIFYIKELQKTYASMDKKVAEAVDMAIEALQFVEHFDLLKEFQSLQEVVRCKDCRHWYKKMNKCNRCPSISGNWGANDFCSWGERKEK